MPLVRHPFSRITIAFFAFALVGGIVVASAAQPASTSISFARDIQPIISSNCFTCHGPDDKERKAGLRLDQREFALTPAESGARAVVPGDLIQSELVRRIVSSDRDEVMPPPKSGKSLKPAEIELLRQWVKQGAKYEPHWAFVRPVQVPLPEVRQSDWSRNPIDRFILARMEKEGWSPAPEADRYTLARRAALDLIGLPPTPAAADRFVADRSPDAYERYVDQLLENPAFGERWAQVWLDLARYADSNGYADDGPRTIWRYRDWVIDACNSNMPYYDFTVEQIAGDLLPHAAPEQVLATGFHRNTLTNSEGGTNDEEFRVAAIVDRVNTTFQAWMGISMQCAQCHNHKYDPITQEEYFRVFAIFNQTEDADRNDNSPLLSISSAAEAVKRAQLVARIAELEKQLAVTTSLPAAAKKTDQESRLPLKTRYVRIENQVNEGFLHLAEVEVFVGEKNVAIAGRASQISTDFSGSANLAHDGNTKGEFENKSVSHTGKAKNPWWEIDLRDAVSVDKVVVWNRTDAETIDRLKTWRIVGFNESRVPIWIQSFHASPRPNTIARPPTNESQITANEQNALRDYRSGGTPVASPDRNKIDELRKQLAGLKGVTSPIMRELPPEKRRKTHIIVRGNFLDLGPEVQPGVPHAFHPLPPATIPDRLSLARWLVNPANTLTARVAVDRYWDRIFGQGLVDTPEDFGVRSKAPVHQDLLDYLAVEFDKSGGNVKQLLKMLVTSATYRQSSSVSPQGAARDPENRFFSRAPRFRSPAETIRDQSLFAANLLREKFFGPPVHPERPKYKLTAAFGSGADWETSPGGERYRRALYTEWRRTAPYPSMVTFDASNRTVCTIRRPLTNTPLQALVTLNDPCFVEAAQALGRRMISEGGSSLEERLFYGFRLCVTRPPTSVELARLVSLYESAKKSFHGDAASALDLATKPLGPLPSGIDPADAASFTVVANVLLNLDEVVAKR